MSAEELQKQLRDETGRLYIVNNASPFDEGLFQLSEEGLRGNHLTEATVEEIKDFVAIQSLFTHEKQS